MLSVASQLGDTAAFLRVLSNPRECWVVGFFLEGRGQNTRGVEGGARGVDAPPQCFGADGAPHRVVGAAWRRAGYRRREDADESCGQVLSNQGQGEEEGGLLWPRRWPRCCRITGSQGKLLTTQQRKSRRSRPLQPGVELPPGRPGPGKGLLVLKQVPGQERSLHDQERLGLRRRRWEQLSSEGSLAQHGQAHPRCPPPSPLVILQEMLQQDFGDKRYTALLDLLKKKPLEIKELGAKKALPKWRRRLSRRSPRLRTQALSFDLGFLWLPKGRGRGTDPALGDELFLLWETSLWCLLAWPTSPTSRGSTWGSCWRKESSQGSLESKTPTLEVKLD
ncbi:uncharacterized protein LOC141935674 [Strix uralensis]|uniref:uncharacterized protein LOC141935674 n=1 Tax=Strix uralensis TaxID=36305 RepID=UPI003DA78EA6